MQRFDDAARVCTAQWAGFYNIVQKIPIFNLLPTMRASKARESKICHDFLDRLTEIAQYCPSMSKIVQIGLKVSRSKIVQNCSTRYVEHERVQNCPIML